MVKTKTESVSKAYGKKERKQLQDLKIYALAGVTELVVALSGKRGVAGLIPGQSTYPGLWVLSLVWVYMIPDPGTYRRQPTNASLSHQCFSLLSPLYKSNDKVSLGEEYRYTYTYIRVYMCVCVYIYVQIL